MMQAARALGMDIDDDFTFELPPDSTIDLELLLVLRCAPE
jgi:hypothetical protein